jgi:hypothetical protein
MYIFVYCISPLIRGFSCIFAHMYMYYICGIWPLWNITNLFLTLIRAVTLHFWFCVDASWFPDSALKSQAQDPL